MYNYEEIKPNLFTEHGQKMFIAIRDNVQNLFRTSKVVMMEDAMNGAGGGSSWDMMACVDRLKELGEIKEISGSGIPAQHRVFVSPKFSKR